MRLTRRERKAFLRRARLAREAHVLGEPETAAGFLRLGAAELLTSWDTRQKERR